ncbi:hypothetical protein FA10DRAFT_289636 [Acaromyces ingoldii]|uniref:Uncharacterized protein n=1 Tax=Acaromyces ingoldii TaxID=215250 RepID=A0A316YCH7_9BASI|nr:hypothetical protein FA10DRAFT_289636 [Acaromyces ingoldii]PWN86584.1 hypothetical protein FA10DRAFT_289636 [Acaromyces ingoldii]
MASIRNDDGTVNLEGVSRHVEHLKGKYAQNAKNYEANTGKKMSFKGAEDVGAASGTQGESAGEQGPEVASQTESKSQEQ